MALLGMVFRLMQASILATKLLNYLGVAILIDSNASNLAIEHTAGATGHVITQPARPWV
jgi:hypothetical protein